MARGELTPVAIHAANPGPYTGDGNWTYLLPGNPPLLIDAGVGEPSQLDALAHAVPDGPARVVVTHAHSDHASGAPAIAARWAGTRFFKMPWPAKDAAVGVAYQSIGDDETFETGAGELQAIHTPGHAPDHIVLWHAASQTLFGGDLLQLGNTVGIPARNGGNLTAYLQSLKRVRALNPVRVWPAHGPVIDHPVALIDQYLAHRHHRETQVLSALEARVDTVEAMTARIYPGLAAGLLPLAQESVLAHLVKLEHDGLVRCEGDRWVLLT